MNKYLKIKMAYAVSFFLILVGIVPSILMRFGKVKLPGFLLIQAFGKSLPDWSIIVGFIILIVVGTYLVLYDIQKIGVVVVLASTVGVFEWLMVVVNGLDQNFGLAILIALVGIDAYFALSFCFKKPRLVEKISSYQSVKTKVVSRIGRK